MAVGQLGGGRVVELGQTDIADPVVEHLGLDQLNVDLGPDDLDLERLLAFAHDLQADRGAGRSADQADRFVDAHILDHRVVHLGDHVAAAQPAFSAGRPL